jgi:MbtH protein
MEDQEDGFICLVNIEGQYSLWPLNKEIPYGWKKESMTGSKQDCLKYINQHWTDMKPISLKS